FHLLNHLGVGLLDEPSDPSKRLAPPIAELLDSLQLRCRLARFDRLGSDPPGGGLLCDLRRLLGRLVGHCVHSTVGLKLVPRYVRFWHLTDIADRRRECPLLEVKRTSPWPS